MKMYDIPQRQKAPLRYEITSCTSSNSMITADDHLKAIYFEAYDTVITQINDRFDQEDYQMYSKLENLLQKNCDEHSLDEVLKFCGDDFLKDELLAQLEFFHANYSFDGNLTIKDYILTTQGMSIGERALLKEVIKLIQLILVLPATNERSFSAMRCTRNYLRTMMTQQRFNSLMLIATY